MPIRTPARFAFAAFAATLLAACASLTDTPPAPRHVEVDGARLAYIEQGRGTPVVFVHGAISDWRTWERQRSAFAAKHRYIAYSQRYFGTGPWPDDGKRFSVQTHADDLAAFIKALNLGPAHLVGWSYSGEVIARVALEHPELVRSVSVHEGGFRSLVASTAEGQQALADFGKSLGPAIDAAKSGDLAASAKRFLEAVLGLPPGGFEVQPAERREIALDNARTIPLLLGAPPPRSVDCATARTVRAPLLMTIGEKSLPVFVRWGEATARCWNDSRTVVIPNADHGAPRGEPAAFNAAVMEFIARN
jgi:pimeloyl-ACP methyl ester carboxylesterase